MRICNSATHTSCYCYDTSDSPLADVWELEMGETKEVTLSANEIVSIIEGEITFTLRDNPCGEASSGQFVFLSAGDRVQYKACIKSTILILRLIYDDNACCNFSIEQLSKEISDMEKWENLAALPTNPRLQHLVEGIVDTWRDGVRCRLFLKAQITELLILLSIYYPKEELYRFYNPVLCPNTMFWEFVRKNWLKHRTIYKLAKAINMTPQQFSKHFYHIFGQPPCEWMKKEKARLIYSEVCQSNKPFKEIADKYGFSDPSNFSRFCKTFYKMPPGELRNPNMKTEEAKTFCNDL